MKAVGIMLMVICHAGVTKEICTLISMFHMPLFFFASGYCFKEKHLASGKTFLWNRIKGLYFPFIKWGLIILMLHNVLLYIGIYSEESGYNNYPYVWSDYTNRALNVIKFKYSEQLLGGYWFLAALFFGSIISWIMLKVFCNAFICALLAAVAGVVVGWLFDHHLHTFGLQEKWFAASFLFLSGHIFAKVKIKPFTLWQSLLAFVVVIIGAVYWPMELSGAYYCTLRIIPYMITAILGIWCVYTWCTYVHNEDKCVSRILNFIGENTMVILTWHFLCFKLVSIGGVTILGLPYSKVGMHPIINDCYSGVLWIAYSIIGIAVPLITVYYYNRMKVTLRIKNT